jgi:hypothetical protein
LIFLGIAVLLGAVVIPLLIWVAGNRILGPYAHGTNLHAGPMALLGDYYGGLSRGWLSYWIVALGPLVIIVFARAAWELIVPKGNTQAKPPAPKQSPNKSNARIEPTVSEDRL